MKSAGSLLFVLLRAGCASWIDARIDREQRIVYLPWWTVESVCLALGAPKPRHGLILAQSPGVLAWYRGRIVGCWANRSDTIILSTDDHPGTWAYEHEMKHRREGFWHEQQAQ
jgi:hypothetical protein